MRAAESPRIHRRVRELERTLGKRVLLRGVRVRNPLFRGRISQRPGAVVLEYRDENPGYFWHYQIIEELLSLLEQGQISVTIYEGDVQYADLPLAAGQSPDPSL